MARKIFLAIVCLGLVAACGHSAGSASAADTSVGPTASVPGCGTSCHQAGNAGGATPAPASAAARGCGTYCQQAGNSAGNEPPGYPCPSGGCLPCPAQNCVSLGSSSATVSNGIATVELTCHLSAECQGAFIMCLPGGDLCQTGPTEDGAGGRVAGSDFSIPPGTTGDVAVALTDLGQQVVSGPGGFSAGVIVDLLNYGPVINTTGSDTGSFALTSTDPPSFPSGATAGCGGTVFAGPDTSCPFAQNVQQAYLTSVNQGNAGTVTATSPVTGQTYTMQCTDGSPVVCMGGTNAVVEFYR